MNFTEQAIKIKEKQRQETQELLDLLASVITNEYNKILEEIENV